MELALAGLGGAHAPILGGWITGAIAQSVIAVRAVAGFGGLVATWVAGGLLAGLLGLFPGLGGPLARAWRAGGLAAGRKMTVFTVQNHSTVRAYSIMGIWPSLWLSPGQARSGVLLAQG